MEYKLKVYSIWHVGQRKDANGNPHQEDSLRPYFGEESENDRTFILCDGMGGHDAGEVASAVVCDAMIESVKNNSHDEEGIFTDDDFNEALNHAYDELDRKDSGAVKKMGTTMTFLKLHRDGATIAHIGDSRVYHIRPGKTAAETKILFQTEDHSLVNDLVKIGEMTRKEARESNKKNVITRAMQPNMDRRCNADIYHTSDILPGDFFYMCSDGMLEKDEMDDGTALKNIFSEVIEDDLQKKEILKGATKDNSDNHTAFIIHITDVKLSDIDKKKSNFETDVDVDNFAIIDDETEENPELDVDKDKNPEEKSSLDKNDSDEVEIKQINTEASKSSNNNVFEDNVDKKIQLDDYKKKERDYKRIVSILVVSVLLLLFAFVCYKYIFNKGMETTGNKDNKEIINSSNSNTPSNNNSEAASSNSGTKAKADQKEEAGQVPKKDQKEKTAISTTEGEKTEKQEAGQVLKKDKKEETAISTAEGEKTEKNEAGRTQNKDKKVQETAISTAEGEKQKKNEKVDNAVDALKKDHSK